MTKTNAAVQFIFHQTVIRYAHMPNCPNLIKEFLAISHRLSYQEYNAVRWIIHCKVFDVLLNTICDSHIDKNWRYICLDNIYCPLQQLYLVAENQCQERQIILYQHELTICSHYFL